MRKTGLMTFILILSFGFAFSQDGGGREKQSRVPAKWQRLFVSSASVPHYNWPRSSPEAQGIDPAIINSVVDYVGRIAHVDSFLIVRNGYLISENYYNGFDPGTFHHVASVSKTYIGALVGVAQGRGLLSLDQKMVDFFPEYVTAGMDQRKHQITVRHLLNMVSGLSDGNQMLSSNWIRYIIQYMPLAGPPLERWRYCTIGVHVLSAIISRVSGMSTLEFANRYLFGPLQITPGDWMRDPQGIETGGFGMQFTPGDMARFGFLYARNGRADGRQIIPPGYITDSWTPPGFPPGGYWPYSDAVESPAYGFLWWLGSMAGYRVSVALGHGAQQIYVIPELDMVVVFTGQIRLSGMLENKWVNMRVVNYLLLSAIRNQLGVAPFAPVNARGSRLVDRAFFSERVLHCLSWEAAPANAGLTVSGYRVYRYTSPDKRLGIVDTDGATFSAVISDRKYGEGSHFLYGITSITAENGESAPVFVLLPDDSEGGGR